MNKLLMGLLFAALPISVMAQEVPTPDEVKKVLDFYYHGQGSGLVLYDSKFCQDIHREGDEKNECAGEITDTPITKGAPVYLWMAYMVPMGEEKNNIIVQFEHSGITRLVKNLDISGSLRYRTWRKLVFDKAGDWTVKIVHDKGDTTVELATESFVVQ